MAIAYAREGADVLISYLNEDAAAEVARLVEEAANVCWSAVIWPSRLIAER